MNDVQAIRLIGERAEELSRNKDVQNKMLEIARRDGQEAAEKFVYNLAIATLYGSGLLINMGNILDEMDKYNLVKLYVLQTDLIFEDRNGYFYDIELYRKGSYLNRLVANGVIAEFRLNKHFNPDNCMTILNVMSRGDIEDFIERIVKTEYPDYGKEDNEI